jgi:Rieske Fe-S protein
MRVETHCQHKGCTATRDGVDMHDGINKERGWTWWELIGLITCPLHYADGLVRERKARRISDA